MKRNAILAIDMQYDFVASNGSLKVDGAEADAQRAADFIAKNGDKIHHISVTLDSHHPYHIANPCYWQDKDGNHPAPFTIITYQDIKDGKWTTSINPTWSFKYIEELEKLGKKHTIWTEHCTLGSKGWALHDTIMDALIEWEKKTKTPYNLWFKGSNWFTEHFSIFKSEIPYPNAPETNLNQQLIQVLNTYDVVFLFGEAENVCVLNSLNDLNQFAPDLVKKLVILEDCMSPIGLFDINKDPVFQKAVSLGAKIMKSTDVVL